ncbi:hypothetical protein GCM10009846_17280 [Agrococcus versicolor]|uniref:Gram-positive cocci surface proteins LPxTG domain-containing protein n=1 Tax=Agrococcus versicolor TaxID=501482 RepID=A0ABN3ASA1_9MICO
MPRPLRRALSAGLVTLLATAGVVGLGASVAQADSGQVFSGTLQAGDPTWDRACSGPRDVPQRELYYDTLTFTVPETAVYGIDMDAHSLVGATDVDTSTDGYFYLFPGTFDPASFSCITSDDDSSGSLRPRIVAELAAGTTYTLVTTQFSNPADASVYSYSGSIRGPLQSVELTLDGGGQDATIAQGETVRLTATFSAPVTGFDASDLGLGDAAADAVVTGSGAQYAIAFTPTGFGDFDIAIPYGAALTAGGSTHTESEEIDVDVLQADPTPTITPVGGGTVTDEPAIFDVVFTEPVIGLEASDVILGGTAGATGVELTGEGAQYRITVTDFAQLGTIEVSLPAEAATAVRVVEGGEGEPQEILVPSVASNVATISYELVIASPPRVTVEQAADQVDPTTTLPAAFVVTFSEPIDDFVAADVVLGGTAGSTTVTVEALPGDAPNTLYRVLVTDAAQAGTITASVAASSVVDIDGTGNLASTSVDNVVTYAPVVAPAPTAPPVAGAGGTLPETGAEPGVLLALAAMLLVAVGAVAARRSARVTR